MEYEILTKSSWSLFSKLLFLSIFEAVYSTKCSKKSDEGWDSSLWWPLWTWLSCFEAVVCLKGVLVCEEAKKSVCLSLNIGQWSVHYWLSVLLSIPSEQIWSCWVVSGKQQRVLQSQFSARHISPVMGSQVFPAAATSAASGLWSWTPAINHALKEGWFNIGQFVCLKWMEWVAHLCFWACPRPHRWVDRGAHWEAPACDCDSAEPHHCPDVLDSITREQWQQHHRVCALPHLPEAKGKSKAWKTLLHWGKERSWSIFQSSKKSLF